MALANVTEVGITDSVGAFLDEKKISKKKLFKMFDVDEADYKKYIKKNNYNDDNDGFFMYLNDLGMGDCEVIEEVLRLEKKKYFVQYDDARDIFIIYEVK